jgi:glycosidase
VVVDTVADAAPTTSVVINDGDGFINNAEKAAVSYTLAGIDASTTATVTFTSSGGGSPVIVSGLGNGTTTANLSAWATARSPPASASPTPRATRQRHRRHSVKDTVADAAPTTSVVINDGDGFINNAEKAAVSYTLAGIDASTTATVTFSSSGGGSPVVVSGLGNGANSVDLSSLGDGNITAAVSVTDTAGNTGSGTGDTSVKDTVADAAPTTSVTINDGDGFINNAEKAAVSYTLAGIDASTTATVTFTSSGGGSPVIVSGLGNGTTTANLSALGDGTITASVSVTDTAGNSGSGTGDTSVKDTLAPTAASIEQWPPTTSSMRRSVPPR